MSVLQRFILCLIALNAIINGGFAYAQSNPTEIGAKIASIMPSTYNAFAKGYETESGASVSCISAVIYGLRKTGFECGYHDFKVYFSTMVRQASALELGKTKVTPKGLILFNRTHFVALYRDKNENGVVDLDDEIIHAFFSPLKITSISQWLKRDVNRPIYYIDLEKGIRCPR